MLVFERTLVAIDPRTSHHIEVKSPPRSLTVCDSAHKKKSPCVASNNEGIHSIREIPDKTKIRSMSNEDYCSMYLGERFYLVAPGYIHIRGGIGVDEWYFLGIGVGVYWN